MENNCDIEEMELMLHSKLNQEVEYVGDMNIIDNLISKKNVMLISQEKGRHIHSFNLASRGNAWIITRDGFKEEREKYPEMDWEDIDARTLKATLFR